MLKTEMCTMAHVKNFRRNELFDNSTRDSEISMEISVCGIFFKLQVLIVFWKCIKVDFQLYNFSPIYRINFKFVTHIAPDGESLATYSLYSVMYVYELHYYQPLEWKFATWFCGNVILREILCVSMM